MSRERRRWWRRGSLAFPPQCHGRSLYRSRLPDPSRARQRRPSLRALAREPVILWPREIHPARYDAILAAFRAADAAPPALLHASQLRTIVSLAAAGAGIGLVPDSYTAVQLDVVVYRRIRGLEIPMALELIWREEDTSPVVGAFLQAMQREARRGKRTGSAGR